MSLEGLDIRILGPAFAAGLLVLSTHVPLGREVLARGIIFIDLAVAQVAGLGVIVAHALDWTSRGWKVQAAAVGAALSAALLLNWTEKRWPGIQEALIGALFVLAASGAVLILAGDPHGGEHLKELLAGQILWVTWQDLIPVIVVYVISSGLWFGLHRAACLHQCPSALPVVAPEAVKRRAIIGVNRSCEHQKPKPAHGPGLSRPRHAGQSQSGHRPAIGGFDGVTAYVPTVADHVAACRPDIADHRVAPREDESVQ